MAFSLPIRPFAPAAAFALASAPLALAQVVPPNFEVVEAATGLFRPVGIAFAPDGALFVTTQHGTVRVVAQGAQQAEPFIDLTDEVNHFGDRGLLGLALHPGFVADGGPTSWVYLLYTVSPIPGQDVAYDANDQFSFSRLARYRATTGASGVTADLSSRQVLLGNQLPSGAVPDAIASLHESHSNGTLAFGADGTLLVATGDGAHFDFADLGGNDAPGFDDWTHPVTGLVGPTPADQDSGSFRSQDLRSLAGKVLRIDPETGLGLPSNPFFDGDPASNASRVWALGLRNPFRFTLLPGTGSSDPAAADPGALVLADVGLSTWEELDLCLGGENFGWPCVEAGAPRPEFASFAPTNPEFPNCNTPQVGVPTAPIAAWHHSDPAAALPAGAFVDLDGAPLTGYVGAAGIAGTTYVGGGWPDAYDGRVFCADFGNGWIHALELDASGAVAQVHSFGFGFLTPVGIERHPLTGDLFVIELLFGRVLQLRYSDPASVEPYGCGVNPAGSLALQSPGVAVGATAQFAIDNPNDTQHPGAITSLGLSAGADAAFPCGSLLPGFGMGGFGAIGELLIDASPGALFEPLHGHPWAGDPLPMNVPVPLSYSLVGKEVFVQGLLFDPASSDGSGAVFGLTNGLRVVVGS